MMRKIRNKISRDEPMLNQISNIYAADIYAESGSFPTSRKERSRSNNDFLNA